MSRSTPVFGGVMDGGVAKVPSSAEDGFMVRLTGPSPTEQTTDYVLRVEPSATPPIALVAAGMKWPILAGVGA